MKTTTVYIAYLLFIVTSVLYSHQNYYASLIVQHPQKFTSYTGTIEEAMVVITPHRSYCINDLFLTFSARGGSFLPDDSIEVQLIFDLLENSFINDLWLWFGTDTLHALLADKSVARATYENIVKRLRRDPALLIRDYNDRYQLNIYPMRGDSTRKVKIRYISPYPEPNNPVIQLPLWIFRSSANLIDRVPIIVKKDSIWTNPVIMENIGNGFSEIIDPVYGDIYKQELTRTDISNATSLTLQFGVTISTSDIFVERYVKTPTSGVVNISMNPGTLLQIPFQQKLVFLIDLDSLKVRTVNNSKLFRINELCQALRACKVESDSFTVIFSAKGKPFRISNSWLPLDSMTIANHLGQTLNLNTILDTIDIAGLIFDGVKFLKENGDDGDIIIFASSTNLSDIRQANQVLDSLKKIMNTTTSVHILDDSYYYDYYSIGGTYYYGNGYFYSNLARQAKGSFTKNPYHDIPNILSPIVLKARGSIEFFDFTTSLSSGYLYAKINSGFETGNLPILNTITSTAFYEGNFPLNIDYGGKFREKFYYNRETIQETSIHNSDSTLETLWANKLILTFPSYYYYRYYYYYDDYDENIFRQFIDLSMRYRILTYYTAFIALEPGQNLCDTCVDGSSNRDVIAFGGVIGVEETKQKPVSYQILQAFPNPFNPSTTLRIRLPQGTTLESSTLIIYNVLGQIVKRFDTSKLSQNSLVDLLWDGKSEKGELVASGVYFLILTTSKSQHSLKLMMLK